MGYRITNKLLDDAFQGLVDAAQLRNIDTSGWSFGQYYGHLYQVVNKKGERGQYIVSGNWLTKREAYEAMVSMTVGIKLVPWTSVVE